jgi:hypothetical protein
MTPEEWRKIKEVLQTAIELDRLARGRRKESCYNRDDDWMFASSREKGRVPRAASTCGKHYLRPAAVQQA